MERSDTEKPTAEEGNQLNRNRSFKSKQLVRSQAIRESQSPPRTVSPSPRLDNEDVSANNNTTNAPKNSVVTSGVKNNSLNSNVVKNNSLHNSVAKCNAANNGKNCVTVKSSSDRTVYEDEGCGNGCGDGKEFVDEHKKQHVEIQITGGGWDEASEQRQRTRRWLGHKHHSDTSRDLLSNSPRVACVCGACACPHCRGRRRRHACPIKQDSGIACSDDCPDCADGDLPGGNDGLRKSESLDVEEQTYYCRCPERKEKPKNISLSRTDSDERTEPSGFELVNFLKETLNKNARDRLTLLKIEKELRALVSDTGRCIVRFPVMTSYGRMLVHRCAALFQLSHHLDHNNKTCVLVSKSGTSGGRIPCTSFKTWCTATFPPSPQRHTPDVTHAKSILKRDTHSLDEPGGGSLAASRSKSLEQRERDYERMKRRIFSTDNCSQDESQWPWLTGGPVKLLTPDTGRNKLLKVHSLEGSGGCGRGGRGPVSKSHSFGGYGSNTPDARPRLLSRQGDLASSSWRLSPSSSGYKTLSLRSTDSVTPSPTGGASPEPATNVPCPATTGTRAPPSCPAVVWCVTDMARVPPGATLIHPQTGRPLANPDGSVYRFDPANPPTLYPPPEDKIDLQNEKKRGKLEKQHSFMDHGECECQPAEETRNKCCCECQRDDATQDVGNEDKTSPEHNLQTPASPNKTRYEQTNDVIEIATPYESPTDQKAPDQRPGYEPANQMPAYAAPTNDVAYNNYGYVNTNERLQYEANQRQASFDQANQRPPSFEQANQRAASFDQTNQRPPSYEQANRVTNQECPDVQYNHQQYGHAVAVGNDEPIQQVRSPPQAQVYPLQDTMTNKPTPVPMPDPNIRPMSLTNLVYPTAIPQGYQYINQCRMEQPLQPVYQQAMQPVPQMEEQKQLAPSPHQESTFRIDPSYPYAAVDYAAQCGACVDPNAMRSYNVPYGQLELPAPVMPPAYPVTNVILPQPALQPYPYQEAVQWQGGGLVPLGGVLPGKLMLPEYAPPVYPGLYAQYGLVYPQVLPQPYPVCQPVYAARSRRGSAGTGQRAPAQETLSRRNSTEIAVKIQQIKEQMAALNTRPRGNNGANSGTTTVNSGTVGPNSGTVGAGTGTTGKHEWRRRPASLLGQPPGHHQRHGRPQSPGSSTDDTQLSSAARAIVNSIRNMQAKNSYHEARRSTCGRGEQRPRRPRTPEHAREHAPDGDRRLRATLPLACRPPYLLRQMSPNTWCRRSPGPVHPGLNHPRRPHPDTRNGRR